MKFKGFQVERGTLFLILGIAAVWLPFLWQLRYSWDVESYYSYGWIVPVLAGVLIWGRVKSLEDRASNPFDGRFYRVLAYVGGVAALALYFVAIVAMGANPFWRFPLWLAGCSLVLISLFSVYLAFGFRSASLVLFPLVFALTMIPWPFGIEVSIVNGMTRFVTAGVVELLHLAGYPAVQYGNVIQVGDVAVGVEEACSGIKSIQALFMLTLFVGAFWKLGSGVRVVLVALGFVVAAFYNLLRSFTLSLIVINGGDALFDEWHDLVGHAALVLSIITVFLIASRFPVQVDQRTMDADTASGSKRSSVPVYLSGTLVLFAILPVIFVTTWYKEPEAEGPSWAINLEDLRGQAFEYVKKPIPEYVSDALGYDYGENFEIVGDGDIRLGQAWYYGFNGSDIRKSLGAYSHTPDICMTGSGAKMLSKGSRYEVDMGVFSIPFQHFVFGFSNGERSQVFWCMWDDVFDGDGSRALEDDSRRSIKIQSILKGVNSHKRRVLLVGLVGDDSRWAKEELRKVVRELVVITQGTEQIVIE